MKKGQNVANLKQNKVVKLFKPNDVRLSFYISPIGDISPKQQLSANDLDNITLLSNQDFINTELFDNFKIDDNELYSLFDEGVLNGCLTGSDLGIYNYDLIKEIKQDIQDSISFTNYLEEDDYGFGHCMLAEEDALGGEQTQIVKTFKGYLEIVKDSEFSIVKRCNCFNSDISKVYIPQYYIKKYQLRNGDELLCTCKDSDGKMIVDSLFTINQESRYNFNCNRPWINELGINLKAKRIIACGEYTKNISNKFKLFEGDKAFIYLTKTSQKNQVLPKLLEEFDKAFDKIVYINSECNSLSAVSTEINNVVKFCTQSNASFNDKATTVLLGAHYVRRMVELGQRIAVVLDDIDSIMQLDKLYNGQMPISKTLFNSVMATNDGGASTIFTLVPLRNLTIKTIKLDSLYKSCETLGIVIENNEVDLFKSYRI